MKNILLHISRQWAVFCQKSATTPLKSCAHQTSLMELDAFIYLCARSNHHQKQYPYSPSYCLSAPLLVFLNKAWYIARRKQVLENCACLFYQHNPHAFLRAAISCTGNQYEEEVRCVKSTQEQRYTITLISVCWQTADWIWPLPRTKFSSFLLYRWNIITCMANSALELFSHSAQVNYLLHTWYFRGCAHGQVPLATASLFSGLVTGLF